jgi:hypothetical protein
VIDVTCAKLAIDEHYEVFVVGVEHEKHRASLSKLTHDHKISDSLRIALLKLVHHIQILALDAGFVNDETSNRVRQLFATRDRFLLFWRISCMP